MKSLKHLFKKHFKYAAYAISISVGRLSEYCILFFAAYYLTKEDYGTLEFYKKAIELTSVGLAFGLPSFLLSYTKNETNRVYLTFLSFVFLFLLSLVILPVFTIFDIENLVIPAFFHAVFFNNGILPVFVLTHYGSQKASIYKTLISLIFNGGVFLLLVFSQNPKEAFIWVNYFLLAPSFILLFFIFKQNKIVPLKLLRYYQLFKKQLLNSLTLVVSNFSNIMFLYTDIMLLKLLSESPNTDIANYSFALNIANMLLLVPFTFVQVDIEDLKRKGDFNKNASRILKLSALFSIAIALAYILFINTIYVDFASTLSVFAIILVAKFFQSQSVLYGAIILIKRKFKSNLKINLVMFFTNLTLSTIFFSILGMHGLALASVIALSIRYYVLKRLSKSLQ